VAWVLLWVRGACALASQDISFVLFLPFCLQVLATEGLTNLGSVELYGGGTRTPAVQETVTAALCNSGAGAVIGAMEEVRDSRYICMYVMCIYMQETVTAALCNSESGAVIGGAMEKVTYYICIYIYMFVRIYSCTGSRY